MKNIEHYNERWPNHFQSIAQYLATRLGDGYSIHHVGSTSIPGMPSKDIIDIDIECKPEQMMQLIDELSQIGYKHQGDLGIIGREAFEISNEELKMILPHHHLYACTTGSPELIKHLAFREYLRMHPDRMKWFNDKKIEIDSISNSRKEYMNSKSKFYQIITDESLIWYSKYINMTQQGNTSESAPPVR